MNKEVEFHCANDCQQFGCPGHTLKVVHNSNSDTYTIWEDGQIQTTYDENRLHAILEAMDI
jgi:hypothetical protein